LSSDSKDEHYIKELEDKERVLDREGKK
ncbi:LapA family protein, partial [Clostridium botulinum]|nr:LapA family protein [Clostridium botulinum]